MYNYVYEPMKELFTNKRGNSSFTKAYCNKIQGEYIVYTGTTIGIFAKINTYDYEIPNLTYTTDGEYAGTVEVLEGKYSIGGHRSILIPKKDNLNLHYFKWILPSIIKEVKRSNCVPTITWELLKELKVPIPVNNTGDYDVTIQQEIVSKYERIHEKRQVLVSDKNRLMQTNIQIELENVNYINMSVNDIFDLSFSTNGSKFTLGFINAHPGDIPVYGAVKFDDKPSYGYVQDNAEIIDFVNGKTSISKVKYFEDCLTYNIDGQGGCGYIFYRKGRFSLSEKVKPLIIREEYKEVLDPIYLKFYLQPLFLQNVRGRKITKEIIKGIMVQIPIKDNGNIDIEMQKEISEKYIKLEAVRKNLCNHIENVLNINLDIA